MEDVKLTKLKTSLVDAISNWIDEQSGNEEWDALDTHVGDFLPELMANSAFNILLAQSDLTTYYQNNNMLKDEY